MGPLEAAATFAPFLHELNKGKGKNSDEFPVLNTVKSNVSDWWDSLDYNGKVDVGEIAIHFHKMSANYKWKCNKGDKYCDLTKSQKKIVDFVFSQKDEKYSMFYLPAMIKF